MQTNDADFTSLNEKLLNAIENEKLMESMISIENKEDIHFDGDKALHIAIKNNDYDSAELLLQYDAIIDDGMMRTIARNRNLKMLDLVSRYVTEYQGDIDHRLQIAVYKYNGDIKSQNIIKELIRDGANINSDDEFVVYLADLKGDEIIQKILMQSIH